MPELKSSLLVGTAISTALLHTLIPDHWLPFVLIGRARRWSPGKTALVSGWSALIHVVLSLALALAALRIGTLAAGAIGETLARASAGLLILFGLLYAWWAWRKGGHFHPGGASVHHASARGCTGDEGPDHPEHLHYHADESIIREGSGPGWPYLAVIVGLNPCVLVLPIVLAAAEHGAGGVLQVSLAYGMTTALLMIGLSVIGVVATRRIPVPGVARHMEMASGLLIALAGIVFWLLE